ncbi:trigger factor [Mycoplasmopsis verecunda]|uniref:Trigger factor n=1 Tax=Mycoplasmopsis verecunda TaxID=171291 RepID=A0A1T4KTE2_9BACT|nr:trigger factor [Mycoplasmopsis verecunda]WPB54658.1 trigger factor [Mycoplasmopsis verecunda]SJZ45702.1 trigger factor [Mycoplasmopsis verecunda]
MIKHTEEKDKAQIVVTVKVDASEFQKRLEQVSNELAKKVKVKGYRPGKAPIEKAKAHLNPEVILSETVKHFSNKHFNEVIEYAVKNEIKVNSQPLLSYDLNDDGLVLDYKFVLMPNFDVDVKDLKVKYTPVKVAKSDVQATIKELEENMSTEVVVEEDDVETQLGDTVNIDFKGFIDNEPFEGGEAKGYNLKLGSKTFIPGFEDQLVGKKKGYEGDVEVTFPSDYFVKEYRDKKAVFQVKINSFKRAKLFKLTDENVNIFQDPQVKDMKSLESVLKGNIRVRKFIENNVSFYEELVKQIIAKAKPVIHESFLTAHVENSKKEFENSLKQYGIKKQEYLQLIKSTEKDLEAEFKKQALEQVTKAEAYRYLVEKYHVNASAEQIDDFTQKFVSFGFSSESAHEFVISSLRMSLILSDINPELAEKLEKDFNEIVK